MKPTTTNIPARYDRKLFLPTTRDEMEMLGWEQADVIIFSADAYVDHPTSSRIPRGYRAAAKLARRPARFPQTWQTETVFRNLRRRHGLDGQPLHGRTKAEA